MSGRKRRSLRVLVLMHPDLVPPAGAARYSEKDSYDWKTEWDILRTLKKLGHDARPLGIQYELMPLRDAIDEWHPDIVFNLLEEFHGIPEFDAHVVSYLELLRVPYTGCNPRGQVLARGKALSKKLVHFHRVHVPAFSVVPRGRKPRRPKGLDFPVIVKSLNEEASRGISQASVVDSDAKLVERVAFMHDRVESDAIIEQYIDGREIYVGIMGNHRLEVFPPWEILFENLPKGAAAIATEQVKHNPDYQAKRGIFQQAAEGLTEEEERAIVRTTKRIYRTLELDGYARIDYRLTDDGSLYFLEANPNPDCSRTNEFASAAESVGIDYPTLVTRIINLGLQRARAASA